MSNQPFPVFFHELTDEQYKELEDSGATWGDVMDRFKRPVWCTYPNALEGEMGCWSLIYRTGVSEHYCRNCELFDAAAKENNNV